MSRLSLLRSTFAACASAFALCALAQTLEFHVPGGALKIALDTYVKQAGVQLVYKEDDVKDLQTQGVSGPLSPEEALARLLAGTPLIVHRDSSGAIAIVQNTTSVTSTGAGASEVGPTLKLAQAESADQQSSTENPAGEDPIPNPQSSSSEDGAESAEEVVVTGSHIRGVFPASSPLEIYTAQDIARTGATTLEQFIQKLPQNVGTRTQFAPGSAITAPNYEAVNGIDLRGLGVGATLVLLNGRRLGQADRGQTADISLIPASAIQRVEILTDGASAIYGSDAVGGVVNFVLRDDFDGAETRLGYGGVSDGGLRQRNFAQTFGRQWGSGRGLMSYDYFSASALSTLDRDYSAGNGPGTLSPKEQRQSVLATFEQDLTSRLKMSGDFTFSRREVTTEYSNRQFDVHGIFDSRTKELFGTLAADYEISGALTASLAASYSQNKLDSSQIVDFPNSPSIPASTAASNDNHNALELAAQVGGALFALPAGEVRFSAGIGLIDEEYIGVSVFGYEATQTLGRRTTYGFGEVFVPLVSPEQGVSLVRRLEISVAGRYTDYEDTSKPSLGRDFGDSADPKIGVLWAPTAALNLRATYGTSFRAPSLAQIDPTAAINQIFDNQIVGGTSASTVLYLAGSAAPNLGPEAAESFSAGFDYHLHPKFKLSATYFNIDYQDRIREPRNLDAASATPPAYQDFFYAPPSAAFIEDRLNGYLTYNYDGTFFAGDPQTTAAAFFADPNFWIFDGRLRNLALSTLDGVDLSASNRIDTAWGEISLGGQVTHILSYKQQDSANSPVFSVVDEVRYPADLRGRIYAGLSRGNFDGTASLNYVDGYSNTFAEGGPQRVESWETVDVVLNYDFGGGSRQGALDGLRVSLSIQNLFDSDPPFVAIGSGERAIVDAQGFDSANANPLGRLAVIGLTKTW